MRMNQKESSETFNALGALFETYRQTLTDAQAKIWKIAIENLTAKDIEVGLRKTLQERTSAFLPSPGEFVALCKGHSEEEMGEQALIAWETVINTVKTCGTSKAVIFKDLAMASTLRQIGGYTNLCNDMSAANQDFKKRDFIKSYIVMTKRGGGKIEKLPSKYDIYETVYVGEFSEQDKLDFTEQLRIEKETHIKIRLLGEENKHKMKEEKDKKDDEESNAWWEAEKARDAKKLVT